MRVSLVLVMGTVVATPLIVVTTSVVNVRMERENEVDNDCEAEFGSLVAGGDDAAVEDGVEDVAGGVEDVGELELELVVGGATADEVVGRMILDNNEPVAVVLELSANCRLSTSRLACSSTGSAETSNIDTVIANNSTATDNIDRIVRDPNVRV